MNEYFLRDKSWTSWFVVSRRKRKQSRFSKCIKVYRCCHSVTCEPSPLLQLLVNIQPTLKKKHCQLDLRGFFMDPPGPTASHIVHVHYTVWQQNTIYRVNHKKRDILFLNITLANLNWFLQFLYHFNREEILHAPVVKFTTSSQIRRSLATISLSNK